MKRKKPNPSGLVAFTDPRSPVTEAYRSLRTNIQFSSLDKPVKTLLVTGANPGCGKTTTTANLGVTLAQAGAAVLLVDTDMRRPTLHKYFGFSNDRGLTNLLVDTNLILREVVCHTRVDHLDVLFSGPLPPNPAELLSTEKMKGMVRAFTEKYDYVLFDSPPIIAVTDAAILSRLVDAVLVVLDYGVVTRDEAGFAVEQLAKVQANVIGAVINGMANNKGHYGYYYYYYYGDKAARRKQKRKPRREDFTFKA